MKKKNNRRFVKGNEKRETPRGAARFFIRPSQLRLAYNEKPDLDANVIDGQLRCQRRFILPV